MKTTESQDKTKGGIAKEWLSRSLQDLNAEKEDGDTKAVAETVGTTVKTIETYLGGDVAVVETGKSIHIALKAIIVRRRNDIERLVA